MYKNDFVTSIISTNVRNVFGDLFGSRTELVRYKVAPHTEASKHIIKVAIRL